MTPKGIRKLEAFVAENARIAKRKAREIRQLFQWYVVEVVMSGAGPVYWPDLGVFYLKNRRARRIKNPQTKALMLLPASKSLGFRASVNARRRGKR